MSALSVPERLLRTRHKFDVEDYHRMAERGVFGPEERVELIEGEIIDMAPIGHLHAGLGNRLNRFFTPRLGDRAIACSQNPIALLPRSEPQPDFALLRYREDDYADALPAPQDVLLLVEIADSSLRYDRKIKKPLYARHGIPEYWLIDVAKRRIEVYLDPDPVASRYRETRIVAEGLLAPASFPDLSLDVRELLR
jgi:Uma2 family endonuclease